MTPPRQTELPRIVLGVLFIGGLIVGSFWILEPFIGALVWAVMIVVPTWPVMLSIERALGGRRWIAVAVMSLLILAFLIVPLLVALGTVLSHLAEIARWAKNLQALEIPPPPSWLAGLPFIGERAAHLWQETAAEGIQSLAAHVTPYTGDVIRWLATKIGTVGALLVQFVLTVVAAAVLYASGEVGAQYALRFGARLAGDHGEAAIRLSGQAIRGVALGVVVTALLQALIAGAGLAIAGVPFTALLTTAAFLLAVAQIGAAILLVPPIIWLYWIGSPGWATFLVVVAVITGSVDNVVRPILIKRGADLPLLLIFVGVVGGLISFGLVGIFVGPVILAVSYTLLRAWLDQSLS
jgi:predicted PurR-regulated permease PerM